MLISFIVPHYNLQKCLLQRCVASIVAQNMAAEDYEILIVDDGSKVPPLWIEKEYCKKNIRLIIAKHGGLGAARNVGMKEASGEYIQFVDSDDCLIKGSVNGCLEILRKECPDILQHGYRICHTEEEALKAAATTSRSTTYGSSAEYASRNNLRGSACMYMFKRTLANSHNILFAEGTMHEDEDFTLKIYYFGQKLICLDSPIYNYCIRENSITSSTDNAHEKKRIEDIFLLLGRVVSFCTQQHEKCSHVQRTALDRKTAMLTVDTLLNLFYNGINAAEIENICHDRLHSLGLYPLPKDNYSLKYTVFSTLANSSVGLKILRRILPSHKPEKR